MSDRSQVLTKTELEDWSSIKRECWILLIDDEAVIREIGEEMLQVLGFSCISATDGREGIRLYNENQSKIAMVILDVEMPDLTGDKVYDQLLKINPAVKILVASGYSKIHLESHFFKRKLDHYMPKPFQMDQLVKQMQFLLAAI